MKECAKICVKKCKRAKNWKIDFADVCIFFFWRQSYLTSFSSVTTRQSSSPLDSALAALSVADFCLFYVPPPPSLGVTYSYPKTKAFTLIISNLYLRILYSVSENNACNILIYNVFSHVFVCKNQQFFDL